MKQKPYKPVLLACKVKATIMVQRVANAAIKVQINAALKAF